MRDYLNKIKAEPLLVTIGLCVCMLAVMGTSVSHVSSTMSAVMFILSFTVIKDWVNIFNSLSNLEKAFLLAFAAYTFSGALSFYNVDDADEYFKMFERFLRFSLIVPVYLFLVKKNISILKFLYVGSVISGPFLAAISVQQYYVNPEVPAQGHYHHIIFGQLAMLNVGIMLSMLLTIDLKRQYRYLIILSMLCGMIAAILSQSRGVWLVFPVYIVITVYYLLKERKLSTNKIIVFIVVTILMTAFTPAGQLIKQRSDSAVSEVMRFYNEQQYISSLGTRLAMWDIAIDVWSESPILGTGPGDFDDEIIELQKEGKYKGMSVHNSVHNIYLQALVGSGVVGLLALLFSTIVMPLKILFEEKIFNKEGRLAGFITVISFSIFGLSESWTLRLPAVSLFLVYIVVITSHVRTTYIQNKDESRLSK